MSANRSGTTNRESGRDVSAAACGMFLVLVVLGFAVPATAQKSKPLKEAEILDLVQGGVSSTRIAGLVDEMGIDFEMTAQIERKFRDAGAQQVLIDALRKASKRQFGEAQPNTASLNIQTKPGEAEVYLNASQQGRRCP